MTEEDKGFIIKDRRIFPEGNQEIDKKEDKKESAKDEVKDQAQKETTPEERQEPEIHLPEINFATFIISLNASALVHLGVLEDPASGKKVKNLAMGKQTIDILSMMEEKTRGNLSKEEESMLKNILYDLKIIYVKEKE
ncbi:MAG: DUF1844 domain-containing protein [Desulfobacterales bacterium]|jgi:hypothetical protein|nr:DUF1844 domain-containing protein [Desulfobacterales bacterium]